MDRQSTHRHLLARESLLALLVIALLFLNFGHVSANASGEFRFAADSWCGSPLLPHAPDHPPCHACRIGGGADLPPPSAAVEPVAFCALAVVYAVEPPPLALPLAVRPAQARGPPAFI